MENIKKILFYKIAIDDDNFQDAAIISDDNKLVIESQETGKKLLVELAKQKGIKSMEQLKESGYYEILSQKDIKENYPEVYKNIINTYLYNNEKEENLEVNEEDIDEDEATFTESIINNSKKILKKAKNINVKKLAIGTAIIGGTILAGYVLSKQNKKSIYIKAPTTKQEEISTEETHKNIKDTVTNSSINQTKKEAISQVWSYLLHYNKIIANKHLANNEKKLAHTWEETMINYLVYNNISSDNASLILDDYSLDLNNIESAYESSIKQDITAYAVLKENSKKASLIDSPTGKDFYNKYEQYIIDFNNSKDNVEKQQISSDFYNEVRVDFHLGEKNIKLENYKLSILPIIKTFNKLTENINIDNKFTKIENDIIDKYIDYNYIKPYFENLTSELSNKKINNTELSYENIKIIAIEELSDNGLYNIDESSRDITNSLEYKNSFIIKEEYHKPATENINNNYETNNNSNNENNNSNPGEIKDETEDEIPDWMLEEEDEIPDWMLEENNQEETVDFTTETYEEETEVPAEEIDPSVYEEVEEVEKDTPELGISLKQKQYNIAATQIINELSQEKNDETVHHKVLCK